MSLTASSTDSDVIKQYENSARFWESYQKSADFCEAVTFLLNRFSRVNALAGKSWTREDLNKQYQTAYDNLLAMAPTSGPGALTHFTRGRPRLCL